MKYTTKQEQDAILWEEKVETKARKLILNIDFSDEYILIKQVDFKPLNHE